MMMIGDTEFPNEVGEILTDLVVALVDHSPAILADSRIRSRPSSGDIFRVMDEYRRQFVPLPAEGLAAVDVFPDEEEPGRYGLDVPLWTREEGQSDLALRLRLHMKDGHLEYVEIEDIEAL